jgi:hypothetical protein
MILPKVIKQGGGEKNSLSKSFSRSLSTFNRTVNLLITSSLLLGATALPGRAVITSYSLNQFADYVQTNNAQPASGSFDFFPTIRYTDSADLTGGGVFYNDVQSSFRLDTPLPSGSGFFISALFNYSTRAELEAAFPDGTDYIYTISGGTLGIQAAALDPFRPVRRFVDDVPFLTGTTYSQLQGLDPSQPFTVTFNGTSFAPIPEVFNSKSFSISPASGGASIFNVSLDPSDTSTLLPANILAPNTPYNFSLGYTRSTFVPNAGFGGASSFTSSLTTTTGSFITGSLPDPEIIGETPSNPLLPEPTPPGDPSFRFITQVNAGDPGTGNRFLFIDPDVAVGYDYTVTGGPNFASVLIPDPLPRGDSEFLLELGSFGNFPLLAGTPFNLLGVNPLGFSSFRISGIDTDELLDPTNPTAFITGLTFTGTGTVNLTQTPIIENIPDPVSTPEPSSLLGLGLLGGGLTLTRRRK